MNDLHTQPAVVSFRDPAGHVTFSGDSVLRTVQRPYDEEILAFLSLPAAASWAGSGKLVTSAVVERNPDPNTAAPALVLRHPRISFPSYPWEWSPSLWHAAATLTLDLCLDLVQQGWILKDATPLNILFNGVEPVFVDVLSVSRRDVSNPLWLAYGQYVRTFLLPLLAYKQLGWPLSGLLQRRDGYEPQDLYTGLGWAGRLRQPARSLVALPVLLESKFKSGANSRVLHPKFAQNPEITTAILEGSLRRLRRQLKLAMPATQTSAWAGYTSTATHYSALDATAKNDFVRAALQQAAPQHVLDVGCNTGTFSALAAEAGAAVVAIDNDLPSLDRVADMARQRKLNILPLAVDLSRPTPSAGWEYHESLSFLDRACGHFDFVLMLAVLHHLLLQAQVPLAPIAALCHRLTSKYLLIEWVPQHDPKFQELLRGRDALYAHLTEEAFRDAFAPHFTWVQESRMANGRSLHLLERK